MHIIKKSMHYPLQKESKAGLNKLYISQGARTSCFNFTISQDRTKFYWGFSKALSCHLSEKYMRKEDGGRWKQRTIKNNKRHQREDVIPVFPLTSSHLVFLSPEAWVVSRRGDEVLVHHTLASIPLLFSLLLLKLM